MKTAAPLALVALLLPAPAFATGEALLEIAMPMYQNDEGAYHVRRHTVRCMLGSAVPGIEVEFSSHPAYVASEGETAREKTGQRNVAWESGINVTIVRVPMERWKRLPRATRADSLAGRALYVDTLAVEVDVVNPAAKVREDTTAIRAQWAARAAEARGRGDSEEAGRLARLGDDSVALRLRDYRAQLECLRDAVLDNAARSVPAVRRVRLRFRGDGSLAPLGGVLAPAAADPARAYR